MKWYNEEAIPYYENVLENPEWGFMIPTQDMDVFVFKLNPTEKWNAFVFNYEGEKIWIRHQLKENTIKVDLYIPARNDTKVSEEEEFSQYRCSLWLCTVEQIKNRDYPPDKLEKHSILADFTTSLQIKQIDDPYFALYHSEWY